MYAVYNELVDCGCHYRSAVYTMFAVCNLDFKVAHGGVWDIEHHTKSLHYCKIWQATTQSVARFFTTALPTANDLQVIRAEALFTNFLVEHISPSAVIVLKAKGIVCHQEPFSDGLLKKCKQATSASLKDD